jgi:hypothetical protein
MPSRCKRWPKRLNQSATAYEKVRLRELARRRGGDGYNGVNTPADARGR